MHSLKRWALAGLLALSAWPVVAQAPGGDSSPWRREFENLRKKYRYNFQLRDMFEKIVVLEKDGKAPLSKEQAGKMLDIIAPLKKKPHLKADQAKQTIKQFQGLLSAKQLQALSLVRLETPGRGSRSGGPRGGSASGRSGSPPDPTEIRKRMQARFKDYNPFYMPDKPEIDKDTPKDRADWLRKRHERRKQEFEGKLALLRKKAGRK